MKQVGLVIVLLSLLLLIKAIASLADGDPTMLAIVLPVLLLLAGGVVFVNRKPPPPSDHQVPPDGNGMKPEAKMAASDNKTAFEQDHDDGDIAKKTPQAIFSVVQTGDDSALDRIERLLSQDARITDIVSQSGRWHTTPDRDDLPEWNALRVYCPRDEVDQVMSDSEQRVIEELGQAVADKVTFSIFS